MPPIGVYPHLRYIETKNIHLITFLYKDKHLLQFTPKCMYSETPLQRIPVCGQNFDLWGGRTFI